MLDDIVISN